MQAFARRETLAVAVADLGITRAEVNDMEPLDVMLDIMVRRYKRGDETGALAAAALAAPYCHARLAQTETTVRHGFADRTTEELLAEAQRIRARAIEHDPDAVD